MSKKYTVAELKKICKEKGIKGYSKLKKAELMKHCLKTKTPIKKIQNKKVNEKKIRKILEEYSTIEEPEKKTYKKIISSMKKDKDEMIDWEFLLEDSIKKLKKDDLEYIWNTFKKNFKNQGIKIPKKLK